MHHTYINCFKLVFIIFSLFIILLTASMLGLGYYLPSQSISEIDGSEEFVEVHGSKIRYRLSEGPEPALILLHGFGGTADEWKEVQPLIHNKSYALDLIGFGASDRPDISYSISVHSEYLHGFIEQLRIQKAILVGRSMGASISAYAASTHNNDLLGAVVIAPSAYPGSFTPGGATKYIYKPGLLNSISRILIKNPIYRYLFPTSLGQQALDVTNSYNHEFVDALNNIDIPILLAWSVSDSTSSYEYHSKYMEKIRDIEFVKLPDSAGHVVVRTFPERTAEIINEFSRKL